MTQLDVNGPSTYRNPPVSEALLSVEFAPLEALGPYNLAKMALKFADRYPIVREMPGVPPTVPPEAEPSFQIFAGQPPTRLWLLNEQENELLQLQNDRAVVNWRRQSPSDDYPGFNALLQRFREAWRVYLQTLIESGSNLPSSATAEYTYVNSIRVTSDYSEFFGLMNSIPDGMPGDFGSVRFNLDRRLAFDSGETGYLLVSCAPATNSENPGSDFELGVSAHVQSTTFDTADIERAIDLAHQSAVHGFEAVTTEQKKREWGAQK